MKESAVVRRGIAPCNCAALKPFCGLIVTFIGDSCSTVPSRYPPVRIEHSISNEKAPLTRPKLRYQIAARRREAAASWQGPLVQRGSGTVSPVCRILWFRSSRPRPPLRRKNPLARPRRKCVARSSASRLESRPESARTGTGQEQTQIIIIANGTPIPNAPPTMFANAESKPNPRLNSLRRDMPLPP